MPDKQDRFKTLLKQNGLKVTTQRIDILEALENRPDKHLTAEEIYECVRVKNPDIGLATVYRTIQLLAELNLIDKLNLGDGFIRYEIGSQGCEDTAHHHHHLICLNCGNVFTFQGDLLETLEQRIQEAMDFEVVDHEVKMFGYCKACRKAIQEKRDKN
ncbi:Fur family transcriptional regulator [Anaerocolumna sp. MB42-C2]|uniref:Fur family transcriptional regulator n=1 Tax=Anaerocolumna sp. MB42-C2 TaxID=3070997 RepID=UPI0027E1295D|nr:Fur family transcriptional regulator [Anaerocolumna sp. MB42-C2]WMJ88609.1 Fur family transcriptional regulator [Anaerocolumna sp. MB42-C2]